MPESENIDPASSLNGAQVTALLSVIERIKMGELTSETGAKVLATAFPLSIEEAANLLSEVNEGSTENDV